MNAYNRKMKDIQSSLCYEKKKQERKEFLDSMSEEERKSFLENEERKRQEARKVLAGTVSMFSAMGIDCKYF